MPMMSSIADRHARGERNGVVPRRSPHAYLLPVMADESRTTPEALTFTDLVVGVGDRVRCA